MALLVQRLTNYHLQKDDEDKFLDWNRSVLKEEQVAYASKDALAHLEVFEQLNKLPDLNLRLRRQDVVIGSKVDFVPRSSYSSNAESMATHGQ